MNKEQDSPNLCLSGCSVNSRMCVFLHLWNSILGTSRTWSGGLNNCLSLADRIALLEMYQPGPTDTKEQELLGILTP